MATFLFSKVVLVDQGRFIEAYAESWSVEFGSLQGLQLLVFALDRLVFVGDFARLRACAAVWYVEVDAAG